MDRSSRSLPKMLTSAIRYIVPKGPRVKGGSIQLLCHVKPGAHAKREGVAAVTDEQIELCVAAQAREGEANKAVREVIAEVRQSCAGWGVQCYSNEKRKPRLLARTCAFLDGYRVIMQRSNLLMFS